MTTIRATLATDLAPELRTALDGLLLSMADDEFVIGFSDSEWTGIAPLLEEDVAMSSLAQDELGHAAALYGLLPKVRDLASSVYSRQPVGSGPYVLESWDAGLQMTFKARSDFYRVCSDNKKHCYAVLFIEARSGLEPLYEALQASA